MQNFKQKTHKQCLDMVAMLNISNKKVREAMQEVPRHKFIDEALSRHAYENIALPIGFSQTISQPEVVVIMTEALMEEDACYNSVLEIGTGCGYQSAILAKLFNTVHSIERIYDLHIKTKNRLKQLDIKNVNCYHSDGNNLQKEQKFDAIIITAAPDEIPQHIIQHLAVGARLVSPEGKQEDISQKLIKINFDGEKFTKKQLTTVDFVPMITGLI